MVTELREKERFASDFLARTLAAGQPKKY